MKTRQFSALFVLLKTSNNFDGNDIMRTHTHTHTHGNQTSDFHDKYFKETRHFLFPFLKL